MPSYNESQMSWMLRKGFAWVEGQLSEWDWHQPIYTREGAYAWMPPYVDGGKVVGGVYERVG